MAKRLDELDYYALLSVAREASIDDIKAAFRAFARRYHPDRYAGDEAAAHKMTRIYRRGTEAYRVLTHPEQRRAYDTELAQGQLRLDPERAQASIRPSMPPGQAEVRDARARPFMAKAALALKAGDFKVAKLNLQIALNYEPDNAVLRSKLEEVVARLKSG